MSDKVTKLEKALGKSTVEELSALSPDDLKKRVVKAEQAMKQVKEELEENPNYQSLKQRLKDLTEGKREVDKRQKAIIQYCLISLSEKGEA